MKKYLLISAAAFFSVAGLCAAETSEFAKAQAQLKEKNPTEFAEIEKLAATDMSGAMEKMRELARKSDVRLPRASGNNRGGMMGGERGGMMGGERGGMMGGNNRGGMMMGGSPLAWMRAAGAMQAKFPEEYAAIAKERADADGKLAALAAKSEVTLPDTPEQMFRKLEAADPAGAAEAMKLAGDDPRAAMRKIMEIAEKAGISLMPAGMGRRGGDAPGADADADAARMRDNPMARLRRLQERYPEEMKRFAELRKSDPAKANALLRELEARDKNAAAE